MYKIILLIAVLIFINGCNNSKSKYLICNNNSDCYFTNKYKIKNNCIEFVDINNKHNILCGTFNIYDHRSK